MKNLKTITLILTSLAIILFASELRSQLVINGDFEAWTGNVPDSWTTIETGISLHQETTIVHGGTSAMNVWVITGNQDNTDFRQNLTVINGHIYDISFWTYQLDTTSRVRLFVDGAWKDYTNPLDTNAWQEITFQYTAVADEIIPLGIRFYDIPLIFVDSSNVIIDDFTMIDVSGTGTDPYITNIVIFPVTPTEIDAVDVFADITDDGTIASAYLYWGTDGTIFGDSINMSVIAGDTYQTDTQIPAQIPGTTVYYYIKAIDNDTEESTSLTFQYVILYDIPNGVCENLFFSEYIEGTGFNKVLEIYNPTLSAIDLSNYSIQKFNNGNTTASATLVLDGNIDAGDVYILANSQADSLTIQVIADTLTAFIGHNGNDTYVLFNYVDTIDIFGEIGTSSNFTIDTVTNGAVDHTLVRKLDVQHGQLNWNLGNLEWYIYDIDDVSFLEYHDIDPCQVNVNSIIREKLVLYPNPVKEILNIDNLSNVDFIQINDILCQTVYVKPDINESSFTYNTSGLEKGIYLISIIYNNNSFETIKFIKE